MTVDHSPAGCPPEAHVHRTACFRLMPPGMPVVVLDGVGIALFDSEVIAERVAELINAHGLLAVPDAPADELPWPPPNGSRDAVATTIGSTS